MEKEIPSEQGEQPRENGADSAPKEPPRGKLHCYDWLSDVPGGEAGFDIVEIQFKNTRKGFYRNSTSLPLKIGDMVAVEASPGHDIGEVTLTGRLVAIQMRKANVKPDSEFKRIFRKARHVDLEKYREAKAKENNTMIRARRIAESLGLNMKIGDVEYQGDGNKAIFYYIADERVDFRQLIKVLAETFHVRIEMKQIGARQEAGRIGGIGPCGRPLCCASWMTNFVSVGTAAARFQDISLNPQKLAGQCAKLKCCLNFEVDAYVEGVRRMPSRDTRLETASTTYYFFKQDVFRREITYSTEKSQPVNLITIDADRAFEVIALNRQGEKPESLKRDGDTAHEGKKPINDILGQDITRFDKKKKKKKNKGGTKADDSNGAGGKGVPQETPVPAATEGADRQEKPNRQEKAPERPPRKDRPARDKERQPGKGGGQQPQRKEGAPSVPNPPRKKKNQQSDRAERAPRPERAEKSDRPEKTEKPDNTTPATE